MTEIYFEDHSKKAIERIKSIEGLKVIEKSEHEIFNKFMSQCPIDSYKYDSKKNTISPAEGAVAFTLIQPLSIPQRKNAYYSAIQIVFGLQSTKKLNLHDKHSSFYPLNITHYRVITDISARSDNNLNTQANQVVIDSKKYLAQENGYEFNDNGDLVRIWDPYRSTALNIFHVHLMNLQPNTVIKLDNIINTFETSTKLSTIPNMDGANYTQSIGINGRYSNAIKINDKNGEIDLEKHPVNINDLKENPAIASAEIVKYYETIQLHSNPNEVLKHDRKFFNALNKIAGMGLEERVKYQFFEFKVEEILGVYDTNLYLDENNIVQKHYKNGPKLIDTNNDGSPDALLTGDHQYYKKNKNGPLEEMVLPKTHLLIDAMVKPIGGGEAFQTQIAVTHHVFGM